MVITNNNNDSVTVLITEFETTPTLGYQLIKVASFKYQSIDRGYDTDKYEVTIKTMGTEDYINSILNVLNYQRTEVGINTYLTLSDFKDVNIGESVFGDNVDYTFDINVVLIDTPIKTQKDFNVYQLEFVLRALDLTFYTDIAQFPVMKCIQSGWKSDIGWTRRIVDSYNNDNFIFIGNKDDRKFVGEFMVTIDQSRYLSEYYRTLRGASFIIDSSYIGVEYPFGIDCVYNSYEVILTKLSFAPFSPLYRMVKLELTFISGIV